MITSPWFLLVLALAALGVWFATRSRPGSLGSRSTLRKHRLSAGRAVRAARKEYPRLWASRNGGDDAAG